MLDLLQALNMKPSKSSGKLRSKSPGLSGRRTATNDELNRLAERFRKANNVRLLAGARRALTCYARKRAVEIGSTEQRCLAGAKMKLTKQGIAY